MVVSFQGGALREFISRNAKAIQRTTENAWLDNPNYKRLFNILVSARQQYKEGAAFKVVAISSDSLMELHEDLDEGALFTSWQFIDNTFIVVNNKLEIVDVASDKLLSDNEQARQQLIGLSKNKLIVYQITPEGTINSFIDGEVYPESLFYSSDMYAKYRALRPIEDLELVIEDYRKTLSDRYKCSRFFIPKASLNSLRIAMKSSELEGDFIRRNKQLLINRPEERFRQDLYEYLKDHIDALIEKETSLDNEDRLDVYVLNKIESWLYLIEIKWLGKAISPEGNKIGTIFGESHVVPAAYNQTVSYIRQLTSEHRDVRRGYLAVFDARDGVNRETNEGMKDEMWQKENLPFVYKFSKIKDFKVTNEHPQ